MIGSSLMISKSCCPFASSNTISFGRSTNAYLRTSNKMDLIPCRSKLRNSCPVTIKPMLKHGVYSSAKDATPETSGTVVPYGFLGIVGLALLQAKEAVAQSISTKGGTEGVMYNYIYLGVALVFVSRGFLGKTMCGFAVLLDQPFSPGDFIRVGYLKGQVIEMGLMTTSLVTDENRRIDVPTCWFYGQVIKNKSKEITLVPYSLLWGEVIVNRPQAPYHEMVTKIYLEREEIEKLMAITYELRELVNSNSHVYLEERAPFVAITELETYATLEIACYLKQMKNEEELYLAKQDVLLEVAQVIRKHGAKLGGHKGKVKSL